LVRKAHKRGEVLVRAEEQVFDLRSCGPTSDIFAVFPDCAGLELDGSSSARQPPHAVVHPCRVESLTGPDLDDNDDRLL
jgi:hypothetical protein